MLPLFSAALDERLTRYLQAFIPFLGNVDRFVPFQLYCRGLLLAEERTSIESIARRFAPQAGKARSIHQSLHHFIADAPWDDEKVLEELYRRLVPRMEQRGPIKAWILDEICVPKRGSASVGVARQGWRAGRELRNSQVVIMLGIANEDAFLPIAHRLYLGQEWTDDPKRRAAAKLPPGLLFQSKASIALEQLQSAHACGVSAGILISELPCANEVSFRERLAELGLSYCLAVEEEVAESVTMSGLPGERLALDESSREEKPRYFLSTLHPEVLSPFVARMAQRRPFLERERALLEERIGFAHYEGRGWRGVRHHMTMCLIAYGFVVLERMPLQL
jgi:SRSO17 transposase